MTLAQQLRPHLIDKTTLPSWLPARARIAQIVLALAALALLWHWREPVRDLLALAGDQEALRVYVSRVGLLGPLVLALLQFIQMLVAFVPGHLLTVAGGYLYGFPLGLALNLVLLICIAQLLFLLARRAGRPLALRLASPALLERLDGMLEREGFPILLITYLLPFMPGDAMNLVAGLSSISARRFLAASILGRLPGTVLLTLVGAYGLQLPAWLYGIVVLPLVLPAVIWLGRRREKRMIVQAGNGDWPGGQ
jgi:uncharacterized membrane protein YdjX (TVP38/TMEM64 family)